ncbi:MAG: flagellar assembly protein FliW [Actinomycetia bacterium]|nr:flagellar assembly protein FliW [Actinomycetes bacterium]
MFVESSRFGSFEVQDDRALTLKEGLLGFPDSTTYVVVEVEDSPYVWLQSAAEPSVAFLATSPFTFFPSYDLELSDEEQQSLGVDDVLQVEVLTLLTVHRVDDEPQTITANLLGPIVINVENREASQLVLDDADYSTREPLVPELA